MTTISINNQLLSEAQRIGGLRTKKATVAKALEEFIQRRKQAKVLELFGTVDFDAKYDYKKQRRKQ
jgi:Arc/MetJ family transcription regulator